MTKEQIMDMVFREGVEFIRLQFTDLFGTLKNVAITATQLEQALDGQCHFDSSDISTFRNLVDEDLYLSPDLDSFVIFPWRPQQGKVARLLCDIKTAEGESFSADSRNILKNVRKRGREMGYTAFVKPEMEFFLLHLDDQGLPTTEIREKASYFDLGPLDHGEDARRDIVLSLQDMGIEVESSFHEIAPEQHEIVMKYREALQAADDIVTFKLTAKAIAVRHGLHATFMPKPIYGVNGSGMHLELRLFDSQGMPALEDEADPNGLSEDGYHFMAGILKHASEMMLITNPLVNSYKRLVPGFDSPLFIGWSTRNRCQILRIGKKLGGSVRMEILLPDPSANPYLAIAALLEAGFSGIREKLPAPPMITKNYEWDFKGVWEKDGVRRLPTNLRLAVDAFAPGGIGETILGPELMRQYRDVKHREWDEFREQVTSWEIGKYLNQY